MIADLVTAGEAAEILGVSHATVVNWYHGGKLRGEQVGAQNIVLVSRNDAVGLANLRSSSMGVRAALKELHCSFHTLQVMLGQGRIRTYERGRTTYLCKADVLREAEKRKPVEQAKGEGHQVRDIRSPVSGGARSLAQPPAAARVAGPRRPQRDREGA